MDASQVYPSSGDFLKASELKRAVAVTIAGARLVTFEDKETQEVERKIALSFENSNKQLCLNKTQARALTALAGSSETDDWIGRRIVLSPATAPNGSATIHVGEPVDSQSEIPF